MANNHMGQLDHGLRIIREIGEICKDFDFHFAFKLQFRHLDTFIHPDYQGRKDIKYVARFSETRLDPDDFRRMKDEITRLGFLSICTPFDEESVDLIEELGFDFIKVGSCSFTDWPLLERIALSDKSVIASTAGVPLEDMDKVVSFFEHRQRELALMHCVAAYPASPEQLQINQIDLLKSRYPQLMLGYSTHEAPEDYDSVMVAIAKGARLFEKHVNVEAEGIKLNAYSARPHQITLWLNAAKRAWQMCGVSEHRNDFSDAEMSSLKGLRRAAFATRKITAGRNILPSDVFFAIPSQADQLTATDFSKYTEFTALTDIEERQPLMSVSVKRIELREKVLEIVRQVRALLETAHVTLTGKADFEISHHYGIDKFHQYGITMITVVNRSYCKKLIVVLPGQKHPEQYHKVKEETFHVLYGDVTINLDGRESKHKAGDVITIELGTKHSFQSEAGVIIEEISSTHFVNDSFYSDAAIMANQNRKTVVTHWFSQETEIRNV